MFGDHDPNSDMPTTEQIPSVLMKNYLGRGQVFYTGINYKSPSLANFSLANRNYLFAMVHKDRFYSKKTFARTILKNLKLHFFKPVRRGILTYKYTVQRDKAGNKPKTVYVLSTYNQANFVSIGKCIKREML